MEIVIDTVSKAYGNTQALDEVSMSVSRGELFGLIGPDGAGKTTLMRILTSLLLPDKGRAELAGLDSRKDFKALRNILGYMPGRFSLYQDLSVEENLTFFASIFGEKFDPDFYLIRDIYAQLAPFKKRLAGRLSGGMKQKLALCCALIHKPRILILDEPTTGVDAVSRKEFWDMLSQLRQEQITTLVSTPYMDEAVRCDRVALIQAGKIMDINTPAGVVDSFKPELYSIATPHIYQTLLALKEYNDTYSVYPFGQVIHFIPTDASVSPHKVQDYLTKKGIEAVSITPALPNIEDCFMELMQDEHTNG